MERRKGQQLFRRSSPATTARNKKTHNQDHMSKFAFLGISAILIAAGNAAKAFADSTPDDATTGTGEAAATPRRGRPAGSTNKPAEGDTAAGPTDAERFEANRALIKPLVDASQGEDVKKVIAKYSKNGLKDLPAASQADFEKDIAALSY